MPYVVPPPLVAAARLDDVAERVEEAAAVGRRLADDPGLRGEAGRALARVLSMLAACTQTETLVLRQVARTLRDGA